MKLLGWVWVIAIVWCSWEFYTAPSYPSDFNNEDGINPDYTEIDDKEK